MWIETFSGKAFYLEEPKAEDVALIDIAWHLSNICRYTGATELFYSVAQHSVLASYMASPKTAIAALMHDAAEAYIGDNTGPLKKLIPDLVHYEDKMFDAICKRFGFTFSDEVMQEVKTIDKKLLATERMQLMRNNEKEWECLEGVPLLDINIRPWSPYEARRRFLERFQVLTSSDLIKDVQAALKELYKG